MKQRFIPGQPGETVPREYRKGVSIALPREDDYPEEKNRGRKAPGSWLVCPDKL
ncbi:MAG: hypothetical protein JO249_08165 [Acidobacteria bacterium]|nr:hypothetical protein [Acidobacteriota bacterium]MBV9480714.1 hypothetical protein [Acidobacteriota bacterium]